MGFWTVFMVFFGRVLLGWVFLTIPESGQHHHWLAGRSEVPYWWWAGPSNPKHVSVGMYWWCGAAIRREGSWKLRGKIGLSGDPTTDVVVDMVAPGVPQPIPLQLAEGVLLPWEPLSRRHLPAEVRWKGEVGLPYRLCRWWSWNLETTDLWELCVLAQGLRRRTNLLILVRAS